MTPHAQRIHELMTGISQSTPTTPCIPDLKTRRLRAKLIFEEAIETIEALGFSVHCPDEQIDTTNSDNASFDAVFEPNIEGIADGCADISVVTIGTLIACGIDDESILTEVDAANLRKIGPGGYHREDGKWMKPADWTPPDIMARLREQGYTGE